MAKHRNDMRENVSSLMIGMKSYAYTHTIIYLSYHKQTSSYTTWSDQRISVAQSCRSSHHHIKERHFVKPKMEEMMN